MKPLIHEQVTGHTSPRPFRHKAAHWLVSAVCLVVLVAGLAKITDIVAFETALRTWSFIPTSSVPLLALLIPLIELALSLMWLLRLRRHIAVAGIAGMIAIFTVAFAWQVATGKMPECGCFGAISSFLKGKDVAEVTLTRNMALLLALVLAAALAVPIRLPRAVVVATSSEGRRGFTLVELMITIVLIGVLVSMFLPALRGVRDRAREMRSCSNLHSHIGVFAAYAAEYKDYAPYFTDPEATYTVIRCEGFGVPLSIRYFMASNQWNYALADAYYNGAYDNDSFYAPAYPSGLGGNDLRTGPTTYHYGCVFIAEPAFWNPSTRAGPSQWRATRMSDVLYPGKKSLFASTYPLELQLPNPIMRVPWLQCQVGMVDGSASSAKLESTVEGYGSGDGAWTGFFHQTDYPFMLHTLDGIRGRDLR